MKSKLQALLIFLSLGIGIHQAVSQEARFFRISGPASSSILAFEPDGTLVWSNALPGATFTIQTVSSIAGGTNWVDYVQLLAANAINTNFLISFNPPVGMVLIPAGPFIMGDTVDGGTDNNAPTNVTVSGFYMDVNLVSYGQWQSIYSWATNHGYKFDDPGSGKGANHPVQTVDWDDCIAWCNARSQLAGLTPVYYSNTNLTHVYTNCNIAAVYANWSANGYRLPTEAEWEKAARGGLSGKRFPWGDTISETQANYYGTNIYSYDLGPTGYNAAFTNGGTPYTSPVGSFAPNGYGLFDMAGNIGEWVWDWYGFPYAGGTDPHGPASSPYGDNVLRGGAWDGYAYSERCANRLGYPALAFDFIGFRCARGL